MIMNRRIYLFFLFAVGIALYFFERDNMFLDEVATSSPITETISVFTMLFISLVAWMFSTKSVVKVGFSRKYVILLVYILLLVFLFSVSYPLGSRLLYVTLLLPLLLFIFAQVTSFQIKSHEPIIWMATIVFLLSTFYFLANYYSNVQLDTDSANSGSYVMLYLLPFLLCHKKRILRVLAIIVTLVVIMFSLKRGGFLSLLAGVLVYLVVSQIVLNNQKIKFWHVIVLLAVSFGLYILIIYVNNVILNGHLIDRFIDDERGGSGRLELYSEYWKMLLDSSFGQLLVGRGWLGSLRDSGLELTCHNDFLESIIDFGLFGFILYIIFYFGLIALFRMMLKSKQKYAPAMAASIAIFFVNSMVSHILIYPKYLLLFSLFWGFMVYIVYSPHNSTG